MALHIPGSQAQSSREVGRAACQGVDGRPVNVAPVLQVNDPTSACTSDPELQLTDMGVMSDPPQRSMGGVQCRQSFNARSCMYEVTSSR